MMRKRSHTQGLDQLGPTRNNSMNTFGILEIPQTQHTLRARLRNSTAQRKHIQITLSDHLFSSDEIKTKEDV